MAAFEEACPAYMQYGMTYHQFWDGDVRAHKQYRKAYKLKISEANTMAWLQGRYFYDALCAVTPILRAFSKAKRPNEYVKEPYDLSEDDKKEREAREERIRYERIKERVAMFAEEFNKQRHENNSTPEGKEVETDGRNIKP